MAAKRTKVELEEALDLKEAEIIRLRDEKALLEAENRRLRTEMQLLYIEELALKANLSRRPVMQLVSCSFGDVLSRCLLSTRQADLSCIWCHAVSLSSRPVMHLVSRSFPVKQTCHAFHP